MNTPSWETSMHRIGLAKHRGNFYTPDTINALKGFERTAHQNHEWKAEYQEPDPDRPMVKAGREIWVQLTHPKAPKGRPLAATWAFAVPMGFTPWNRHPVPGLGELVFHYLGPWSALYDRLCAEGRGHLAWPSVCAAALVDVGRWEEDKTDQRFVQAQLHRLGLNCGPIDGEIGPRTVRCLETLGMGSAGFDELMGRLKKRKTPEPSPVERGKGHLVVPGWNVSVAAYGGVEASKTSSSGASFQVSGPGRIVVDVGIPA